MIDQLTSSPAALAALAAGMWLVLGLVPAYALGVRRSARRGVPVAADAAMDAPGSDVAVRRAAAPIPIITAADMVARAEAADARVAAVTVRPAAAMSVRPSGHPAGHPCDRQSGGVIVEPLPEPRSWTFVAERVAANEFARFLRDMAAGVHPLAKAREIAEVPGALVPLLEDRAYGVDWMLQDEVIEIYRGWCRLVGYMPMDRWALCALLDHALGAERRRLWLTSDHCARLRLRYPPRMLPKRPTCIRVWSHRELAEVGRQRQAAARQVLTRLDDSGPMIAGPRHKPRKRILIPRVQEGLGAADDVVIGYEREAWARAA